MMAQAAAKAFAKVAAKHGAESAAERGAQSAAKPSKGKRSGTRKTGNARARRR